MSDIHGNQYALQAVLERVQQHYEIDACVLLGDIIDYGMHSNEVICMLNDIKYPIICNIWGNHEEAIMNERYQLFSSERGEKCARYTRSLLNDTSWEFVRHKMLNRGHFEFEVEGKKFFAVHGSMKDEYWKSIGIDESVDKYGNYDYVLSGHSHYPHFIEKYIEIDNPITRNKKKVIFINPGSVGQPRNINCNAQFSIINTKTEGVIMDKVSYNIEMEQLAFTDKVDDFYRSRLEIGV